MSAQKIDTSLNEFEQFIALPENSERLFELINGELVEKVPTEQHGTIAANATTEFNLYKRQHGGRVTVESRYRPVDDTRNDRLPDVAYTRPENVEPIVTKGAVLHMPDLILEIKSPSDTYLEMREKALYYLKNGASLVWLVFPERQEVEVHTADTVVTFGSDDALDGGNVLPEFTLPVRDLFTE